MTDAVRTVMPLRVKLRSIEIVEDRTAEARADEGYLRLARLRLRNEYEDGSHSRVYSCDVGVRTCCSLPNLSYQ